ncbi:MAG: hypothetical protein LBG60_15940 [Bifidobacteriaceae bacterium]|jgi:beta-mannosidase|nr:hypothetical protein [Bifidobacteriaceae bacterium]
MSDHRIIPLDSFDLTDLPAGSGDPAQVAARPDGWLPAVVPGGVRESLLAAGRIDHPYYGANERKDAWIDQRDWWYRGQFPAPEALSGDRVRLVFAGLDTVADVWLNGQLLGHHENQFRPAVFDVTDALQPANTLVIRFAPPLAGRTTPPEVAATLERLAGLFEGLLTAGKPDAGSAGAGPDGIGPVGAGPGGVAPADGELDGIGPVGADSVQTAAAPAEEAGGPMNGVATTLRKAPFSWGWDFGPNVPSIGLWRPVHLSVERGAVIAGHHVAVTQLSQDGSHAWVKARVEVDAFAAENLTVSLSLTSPSGKRYAAELPVGPDGLAETRLSVPEPELWWTHDLGGQPLYQVEIELAEDGRVLDAVSDQVGLRTLVVDRSKDPVEGGRFFRFQLNGRPVFARGANWLPLSTLVGSISPETYRDRVSLARDGNFNCLRVWGGGIYEHDAFYAACDQSGVLVWQDFIFACTDYPSDDPVLQAEVTAEAEYQVKRLRNRASLALWAGNNEVQIVHLGVWGNLDPGGWGWHFFHQILPAAVARHDGLTFYWPGSCWGEGSPYATIGDWDGDRHTWEVWHGDIFPGSKTKTYPTKGDERHYRRYGEDRSKFVSEFGIHASPELATLRRWIPEADLAVHAPVFDLHNKDNPKNKADELLAVTTGLPDGLEQYVAFTQAVQAEGMAFGIAHYRRRQPHCAGALMWQFNDVWPGFSWSVVDFDGIPKAAYFAAKRVCAPVAVSFADRADGGLELWLVNNGPVALDRLAIDVELGRFDGSERRAWRVEGSAPVGGAAVVWMAPAADVPRDPDHYAWATSPDAAFPAARQYFAEIGQLRFGASSLTVTPEPGALRIRSEGHSYQVRIAQPRPDVRLSDNCFDLRDGDQALVTVKGINPADLAVSPY